MAHDKRQKLEEKIKTISVAVSLFVTIGGVAIGIFNYLTLNQLAPLSTRITQIEANEGQIKDELVIYRANQTDLIDKLATKEQMAGLSAQIEDIKKTVNYLYQIHVK
jgi:hypothetical protein